MWGFSVPMFPDAPSSTLGILVRKSFSLIHQGLDRRHIGQVRTAGSSYKKNVYKSAVLASATLTKLLF